MTILDTVTQGGLAKTVLDHGGCLFPLIIPADKTNGTGLMNPSIFWDGDRMLCNIRHVNYTLYHSENKRFQHRYGPLQYLHPENDRHLRTWNYMARLDSNLQIRHIEQIDTSELDQEPIWEFVGLEDARVVRWDDRLYLTGVRRDTTTNGQGRMELSEIVIDDQGVREIARERIPAPGANTSYCEKNWMPVLDQPYHYVKWTNPTEVVRYDPETKTTNTVFLDHTNHIPNLPDLRGGSQVIPYGDHYLALTHEVDLFKSEHGQKDAVYRHRFIVWTRDWHLVKITPSFSFMGADIEFCCGAAWQDHNLLVTFGYQDNAAFLLKIPGNLLDQILWGSEPESQGLNWGAIQANSWFMNQVYDEIFVHDVYQMHFPVEAGDVVVDIGASVGPFAWKIDQQQAAHIYCLEPEPALFKTLSQNAAQLNTPVTLINSALGKTTGDTMMPGLFDATRLEISDGTDLKPVHSLSFTGLLAQHNIDRIDFLKTDSEGAEYEIFNDENFEWVTQNVRKIAGEFHLNTPELKAKFRRFRDTYLRQMTTHQIQSLDYVNIKPNLWSDWFIEYYAAINVWIDNRVPTHAKRKWQHHPAPTLEVTTTVPAKGCVVDCVFCPQRLLVEKYQGNRVMTLEDFQRRIESVPREVRITFSGFVEPWLNKHCSDMVLYAHERGHPVSVFTTGIGMSVEDIERIAHIPYVGEPNGGFTFHLPDSELLAKHPITPGYIRLCEWIRDNQDRIQNFQVMSMGTQVHPDVAHCFDRTFVVGQMWDRAGNLSREAILKPELMNMQNRWNRIQHTDGPRTCGCVENLYHNVMLPNGDVSLCCMDYGLDNILGNLDSQTWEEIIPEPETCYTMCLSCENGAHPAPQPLKFYPR
jgi:FkbM family methyltransferase